MFAFARFFCVVVLATFAANAQVRRKSATEVKKVERAPEGIVYSTKETKALRFTCSGEPPFGEITCTFTQLAVFGGTTPTAPNGPVNLSKLKANSCALAKAEREYVNTLSMTDESRSVVIARIETWESICACQTDACTEDVFSAGREYDSSACSIVTTTFEFELERRSATKWIGTKTQGICDLTLTISLERGPNDSSWVFRQHRLPGTMNPICPDKVTDDEFRWDLIEKMDLRQKCKSGLFGFSFM